MRRPYVPVLLFLCTACAEDAPEGPLNAAQIDIGPMDAEAADASAQDLGPPDTGTVDAGRPQDTLLTYLLGDFDNRAQFEGGFPQLVERHVCPMPGLPETPGVTWLYVEHVETVAQGRDAYFIRVNRVETRGDTIASKAYRFPTGHPLRTDAFAFNGPRDACFNPSLMDGVSEATLEYREGCDVSFMDGGDRFDAMSPEQTCTFPGGWIQTLSTVFPDGLDSRDRAVTPQGESGSTFEFRRVTDFMPPGS